MTRPTGRQVGLGFVALVVLAVLALIAARLAGQADTSASASGGSTSETSGGSTGTSTPGEQPLPAPAAPPPAAIPGDSLDIQVKTFVEAYYRIDPGDTDASRRDRVAATGLASAETMQMLDFTLSAQDADYQAYGITQQATVDPPTLATTPVDGTTDRYLVTVPVKVTWVEKSGRSLATDLRYTVSTWQYTANGTWTLLDFSPEEGQ
jgi:hypothetical protein